MKLFAMSEREYVEKNGNVCPVCGAEYECEGGFVEIDNGRAYQPMGCGDCGSQWYDVYSLAGITELDIPETRYVEGTAHNEGLADYVGESELRENARKAEALIEDVTRKLRMDRGGS